MVKNSKYLFICLGMISQLMLQAQTKQHELNILKRDSEITRVTLQNHFKNWNGLTLLNQINATEVDYTAGKGITVTITAPHTKIYFSNGTDWSFLKDQELLDSFYDEKMISIQQKRLKMCLADFIADFSTYLPQISDSESYHFVFEVEDDTQEKEIERRANRHYQYTISISSQSIKSMAKGTIEEIENEFIIDIKPL